MGEDPEQQPKLKVEVLVQYAARGAGVGLLENMALFCGGMAPAAITAVRGRVWGGSLL